MFGFLVRGVRAGSETPLFFFSFLFSVGDARFHINLPSFLSKWKSFAFNKYSPVFLATKDMQVSSAEGMAVFVPPVAFSTLIRALRFCFVKILRRIQR